jgi:hypothetical protein
MIRRAVSVVFYACFAAFVVWYLRRLDLGRLTGIHFDFRLLTFATLLSLLFRYCGVIIWLRILKGLGAGQIGTPADLSYVYAKSWLGRYLPGKVTWILGKVYFASEQGIPKRKLAVSSVFEGALQTSVTLFLSLLLLSIDARLDVFSPPQKAAMIVGSVVLLVAMTPPVFNHLMGVVYSMARKQRLGPDDRIDLQTLARGFVLYGVGFVLSGAAYFFFTRAIYAELGYEHFIFVAGVFNLAGAIGILSLFAPSGLGVREGIQLLLLPLVMPAEVALVVTVAARVWSLGVDLLFFGVTWSHRALRREASRLRRPGVSHKPL